MVVRIAGKRMYLWRAVDHEGEVLDMLVQRRRDKRADAIVLNPNRSGALIINPNGPGLVALAAPSSM
jgi:hypothetical protein